MAGKSVNSDAKVMDVSKPGTGKISTNSKPIIVGSKSNAKDTTMKPEGESTESKIPAPSTTRKVIQPISEGVKPEEAKSTAIKVLSDEPDQTSKDIPVSTDSKIENSSTDLEPVKLPDLSSDNANENENLAEEKQDEPQEEIKSEEPKTEQVNPDKPTEEAPKPEEPSKSDEVEEPSGNGGSDAAGVDELAKSAEAKKDAARKADEEILRNSEIDDLAASKKFYVKTGHNHEISSGGLSFRRKLFIFIVIAFTIFAGGYLLLDSNTIKNDLDLPYEFFEEEVPSTNNSEQAVNESVVDEEDQGETTENTNEEELTPADEQVQAEIREVQTALETYFAENGRYPSFAELNAQTFRESNLPEIADMEFDSAPGGSGFAYQPDPEDCGDADNTCQSYELSATLSDGEQYTVNSVNL